jgi:N-acetylglucosamine-6-phosphate deacetylase
LSASLICDGFHLPPDFVNVALRSKGIDHCILITDAVMATTLAPGRYRSLDADIELLPNNKVVMADGKTLAGSAATLNHVVEVFMRYAGATLADALDMATINPARLLGAKGMCLAIAEGQPANLFLFQPELADLGVIATFLAGDQVSGS